MVQFYGSTGTLVAEYHYCKEGDAGWGDLPAGWFDGDEEEVKDRVLDASEGFTVFANGSTQAYLKFPSL